MKLQKLLSFVRRAVDDYNMIQKGDKIAVGISGGKDGSVRKDQRDGRQGRHHISGGNPWIYSHIPAVFRPCGGHGGI